MEVPAGEDLKEAILHELDSPENLSEKRRQMREEYFYNIGSSAKYAISKIYQILNLEEKENAREKISS